MTTATMPWAFGNVERTDKTAHRQSTIREIATHAVGGWATYNEADKDAAFIHELEGFDDYTVGENSVIWDSSRYEAVAKYNWLIMLGGRRGDGKNRGDKRRRGPNRYLLLVVLRCKLTGVIFFVSTKHDIAKFDTTAKWRRFIRNAALAVAGAKMAWVVRQWANGVMTGDWNSRYGHNLPGVNEVEVPTPATMGKARYDRIARYGSARVWGVLRFRTMSDHWALMGSMSAGDTLTHSPATKPPAAKPARPKAKPKPKPKLTVAQRKRLARLERIARPGGKKLRPFQRRALRRLRAKAK